MSDIRTPIAVDQLEPINPTGRSNKMYPLNKATVHPTRIIGRDRLGRPIEDTVPTVRWGYFLMMDGCTNKVPLRTGSVTSNHADAQAYEQETMHDMITGSAIPAWMCPFSTKYTHITGGAFVQPGPGDVDCGGVDSERGCVHLQALAKDRLAEVKRVNDARAEEFAATHQDEMRRMRDGIVEGVGAAMAEHLGKTPQQRAEGAKQRLREGKGETE